jgi:DNA-binding NarL/FixJ family response regulator
MQHLNAPRRIAIADDSPAFLAAAAAYLASLPGYVLAGTAANASEALELVASAAPDILLLDLGLAPTRGLEIVRRVRAAPHAPVVIALSLFHTQETAAEAAIAGAAALIGKEAFVTGLSEILPKLIAGAPLEAPAHAA